MNNNHHCLKFDLIKNHIQNNLYHYRSEISYKDYMILNNLLYENNKKNDFRESENLLDELGEEVLRSFESEAIECEKFVFEHLGNTPEFTIKEIINTFTDAALQGKYFSRINKHRDLILFKKSIITEEIQSLFPLHVYQNFSKTNSAFIWALGQYDIAREYFRKGMIEKSLNHLDLAIEGDRYNSGYPVEYSFHVAKGIILLGANGAKSLNLIDLKSAEKSFAIAAKLLESSEKSNCITYYCLASYAAQSSGCFIDTDHYIDNINIENVVDIGELYMILRLRALTGYLDQILLKKIVSFNISAIWQIASDPAFLIVKNDLLIFIQSITNELSHVATNFRINLTIISDELKLHGLDDALKDQPIESICAAKQSHEISCSLSAVLSKNFHTCIALEKILNNLFTIIEMKKNEVNIINNNLRSKTNELEKKSKKMQALEMNRLKNKYLHKHIFLSLFRNFFIAFGFILILIFVFPLIFQMFKSFLGMKITPIHINGYYVFIISVIVFIINFICNMKSYREKVIYKEYRNLYWNIISEDIDIKNYRSDIDDKQSLIQYMQSVTIEIEKLLSQKIMNI